MLHSPRQQSNEKKAYKITQRRIVLCWNFLFLETKKKIILLMTRHIVFLCYVVALVKCKQAHSWKVVTESIHQADYEYVLRQIRDSEDWNHEILYVATWLFKYLLFQWDFTHYSKRGSTFIPECSRHGTVLKSFLHKWSKRGIPQGNQTTASVTASKPTVPEWMGAGR